MLGHKSVGSPGLTPLRYLAVEQVLGPGAMCSGQLLRTSGSKVTRASQELPEKDISGG